MAHGLYGRKLFELFCREPEEERLGSPCEDSFFDFERN